MAETQIAQMILEGQEDLAWFDSHMNQLMQKYNNMFIAFHDKKVIDADADMDSLMKRLKKRGVDTSKVLIEFVSRVKTIL